MSHSSSNFSLWEHGVSTVLCKIEHLYLQHAMVNKVYYRISHDSHIQYCFQTFFITWIVIYLAKSHVVFFARFDWPLKLPIKHLLYHLSEAVRSNHCLAFIKKQKNFWELAIHLFGIHLIDKNVVG